MDTPRSSDAWSDPHRKHERPTGAWETDPHLVGDTPGALRPRGASRGRTFVRALFLGLALLVLVAWAIAYITILNPSFAKSTLESSGVYGDFAETCVDILTSEMPGASGAIAVAGLTPPFQQALPPELLRTNTEAVVDSLDAWLEGDTGLPRFLVETGAIRSDLNQAVAGYITERFELLPVCPASTDYDNWDPFTAGCRPPGRLNQTALLTWADDFTKQIPLLGRQQLSDADLVTDGDAATFWRVVPQAYWWGKVVLGVLAGLLVVAIAVTLAAGRRRRWTLRTLGHSCLWPAVVLLVGGAVMLGLSGALVLEPVATQTQIQADFSTQTLLPVLRSLFWGVGGWLMILGVALAALAIAAYLVARSLGRVERRRLADQPEPGRPSSEGRG